MTEEETKFAGGVAVITGAGSGIGMGLAQRAAAIGMTVVVTDVIGDRAQAVADEICERGGAAEAMRVDVSHPDELDQLADTTFARHGAVRLLVNNAGMETLGCIWEIPTSRWDATLNVNIHGIVHGVRAFVPRMIAAGEEAWIANLASGAAFGMIPTQVAYVMTKHAVQAFTEGLYLEMDYAGLPIHVSSVLPGMVKTRIFDTTSGAGESEAATPYREGMRKRMESYGMELPEACERIMRQIAANEFWVSTHPEQLKTLIASRVAFLNSGQPPALNEQTRRMLDQ